MVKLGDGEVLLEALLTLAREDLEDDGEPEFVALLNEDGEIVGTAVADGLLDTEAQGVDDDAALSLPLPLAEIVTDPLRVSVWEMLRVLTPVREFDMDVVGVVESEPLLDADAHGVGEEDALGLLHADTEPVSVCVRDVVWLMLRVRTPEAGAVEVAENVLTLRDAEGVALRVTEVAVVTETRALSEMLADTRGDVETEAEADEEPLVRLVREELDVPEVVTSAVTVSKLVGVAVGDTLSELVVVIVSLAAAVELAVKEGHVADVDGVEVGVPVGEDDAERSEVRDWDALVVCEEVTTSVLDTVPVLHALELLLPEELPDDVALLEASAEPVKDAELEALSVGLADAVAKRVTKKKVAEPLTLTVGPRAMVPLTLADIVREGDTLTELDVENDAETVPEGEAEGEPVEEMLTCEAVPQGDAEALGQRVPAPVAEIETVADAVGEFEEEVEGEKVAEGEPEMDTVAEMLIIEAVPQVEGVLLTQREPVADAEGERESAEAVPTTVEEMQRDVLCVGVSTAVDECDGVSVSEKVRDTVALEVKRGEGETPERVGAALRVVLCEKDAQALLVANAEGGPDVVCEKERDAVGV